MNSASRTPHVRRLLRSVVAPLFLLAVTGTAEPVAAHLGQEFFGRHPFVEDGAVVGGNTTWGLVLPAETGGDLARVCEEAVGPLVTFALAQPEHGRVILGTEVGLVQTSDAGCSASLLDNALRGNIPTAAAALPTDPETVFVIASASTAPADGPSGLWVSTDGGDSFVAIGPALTGALDVLAVDDIGSRVCVAGRAPGAPPLLRCSSDGGTTFANLDAVVNGRIRVSALVLLAGGDIVVAGLDATAEGFVDRIAPAATGGPAIVAALGPLPRHVTHAAIVGDTLAVLARNGPRSGLFVTALSRPAPFVLVDGGPTDCLVAVDGHFYGCGKDRGAGTPLFLHSTDGLAWESAVSFAAVRPRLCPADTSGTVRCPPVNERACGDFLDDDYDGDVDCDDEDCTAACAADDERVDASNGNLPGSCAALPAAAWCLPCLVLALPWFAARTRAGRARRDIDGVGDAPSSPIARPRMIDGLDRRSDRGADRDPDRQQSSDAHR